MELDNISVRIDGKLFMICLPDSYDEKTIDNMLSKVKFRLMEQN